MAFSRAWLDDLVDRTDIVQVVSRHVQLTKRGNRYWGLCPFHMEKSASFTVNPQMQMYYCFGCHASGGAINFLMEMEHMEFKEAVAFLADEAHIPLPENFNREREKPEIKGQRERIYELNREYAIEEALKHVIPARKMNLMDVNLKAIQAGKDYRP